MLRDRLGAVYDIQG